MRLHTLPTATSRADVAVGVADFGNTGDQEVGRALQVATDAVLLQPFT